MTWVKLFKKVRLVLTVIVGVSTCASPSIAQESEQAFFAGKTVRLVVGFGTGGGFDAYARMLAPYLAKNLGATVIVENRPGAGGLLALNFVYAAPPDGLTMLIVNGTGAATAQLTDQEGARFDLGKFGYLATLTESPTVWLVGRHFQVKTVGEALKAGKKWRWAASGPADNLAAGAAFTCEALKLDCQTVLGYKGSNDAALALARGEADALNITDSSAHQYVQSNGLLPLATISRVRTRYFPDLPTIFEAVKLDADQEYLFNFRHMIQSFGRVLVVPPGLSRGRLAFMEAAVKKTVTDPEFLAEGDKRQLYTDYLDGATTSKNALGLVENVTPDQKKRVKAILLGKQ